MTLGVTNNPFFRFSIGYKKRLILTVWGAAVVGTIDNLLRPMLVGKRLKLHTVLAFISVVGGLILFGPAGLILGPVVLTITTELLVIWRCRSTTEAMARVEPDDLSRFENEGGPEVLAPAIAHPRSSAISGVSPEDAIRERPSYAAP